MSLYAAYAGNLDARLMTRRAPHSPLRATGWLNGWRLRRFAPRGFGGSGVRGSGGPAVRGFATVVWGSGGPPGYLSPSYR